MPDTVENGPTELRYAVPEVPRLYVPRRRLTTRLDEGAAVPLTLVSAPAGSGKTALVADWVSQGSDRRTVGWITCEAGDDRPARFWRLVAECLRACGVQVSEHLSSGEHPSHRRLLTELSSSLARLDAPVHLVLDGLEVADARLAADVDFVLAHSGRRLRLVILTRVDPVLPLHRFRLDDTMVEVRMSDLAFSVEETARLLELSGVRLSHEAVTTLLGRTRGWAVGLRFATMLLAASGDPDAAVHELAGDRGNIAEYLMAEMLRTQSDEVRSLMLRTSVVDLLQPGLTEELAGRSGPRALDALARANVLLQEVPGRPGCYQYHPLLRDLLRAELGYTSPQLLPRLQRRAARWFAHRGLVDEAVALAAAATAWSEAADCAVGGLVVGRLLAGDDGGGTVRALRDIPSGARGASAAVVRATLALVDDDTDLCAHELRRAQSCLDRGGAPVPAAELAIGVVDSVRSSYADGDEAVPTAEEAASRIAAWRGERSPELAGLSVLVQTAKGIAHLRGGDRPRAREVLEAAVRSADESESRPLPFLAHAHLSLLACLDGRLTDSVEHASRAIALAEQTQSGGEPPQVAQVALGWVSAERYELVAGHDHLEVVSGSRGSDPVARALSALVRSRLHRSGGHVEAAADELLHAAAEGLPERAGWLADLVAVEAAETRTARGDAEQALAVLEGLRRPEQAAAVLARARAQLARRDWSALARTVTGPVSALAGDPGPWAVEAGVLEAAHHLHAARRGAGTAAIARSLRQAAPERVRRPFRQAPEIVRELLETDPSLALRHPWLGMGPAAGRTARVIVGRPVEDRPESVAKGEIIEPLTAREREVLRHLSDLLTTEEIAATMYVSVNTVRTHVRNILRKLAVSRRNEAVRRGRALSLIGG